MPTSTAAVIISDALKEIGVISEGETPSAGMYSDGLRMLNRLLDTFSHKEDFEASSALRSLALTGQQSFDVGPTGDLVTLRPIKISSAYATKDGIDYPVEVVDLDQYDTITMKSLPGSIPDLISYNGVYPDGVVYVYPLCANVTLNMRTVDLVKNFSSTSTNIDMPEGYEDAIMLSLAIRMAPSYTVQVNQDTRKAAKRAMGLVERTNRIIPTMDLPSPVVTGSTTYSDYMAG